MKGAPQLVTNALGVSTQPPPVTRSRRR